MSGEKGRDHNGAVHVAWRLVVVWLLFDDHMHYASEWFSSGRQAMKEARRLNAEFNTNRWKVQKYVREGKVKS